MKRIAAILLLAGVLCHGARAAEAGPQPPCSGPGVPPYPDLDHSPAVKVWDGRDWKPPSCTGWAAAGASVLVTTVARFRHASGVEGLRNRIAAVSRMAGMLYWSTTRQSWQTLVVAACAVPGPGGAPCRKDFLPDDVAEGGSLFFEQEDNVFGKGIYRLHVRSAAPGRLAFGIENVSAVRFLLLTVFQPGEMQAMYFLERESPEVWRYYGVARMGGAGGTLAAGHEASSINRAVALYRYLAGIPMNLEPPAAR